MFVRNAFGTQQINVRPRRSRVPSSFCLVDATVAVRYGDLLAPRECWSKLGNLKQNVIIRDRMEQCVGVGDGNGA